MKKNFLSYKLFSFLLLFLPCLAFASPPSEAYLHYRLASSDKRYPSFLLALELLKQNHSKTIVETGTSRYGDKGFVGDGGSTIIFGDWARQNDAVFYSVDIDPNAVQMAKNYTSGYGNSVQIYCDDSINFLASFPDPIDFLYLDSFDFELNNPGPSQEHHLKEIIAVYPKLHSNSIIMIDDCGLLHGGKGKLVLEYLDERGWKILYQGYQVILRAPE